MASARQEKAKGQQVTAQFLEKNQRDGLTEKARRRPKDRLRLAPLHQPEHHRPHRLLEMVFVFTQRVVERPDESNRDQHREKNSPNKKSPRHRFSAEEKNNRREQIELHLAREAPQMAE